MSKKWNCIYCVCKHGQADALRDKALLTCMCMHCTFHEEGLITESARNLCFSFAFNDSDGYLGAPLPEDPLPIEIKETTRTGAICEPKP